MAIKRILFTAVTMTVLAFNISGQEHLKKLMNAEFAISQFYVDSISEDKLVEDAIKGMLQQLDPHSSYSTPEETKELEEPLEGEFSGIGIQFNMNADTLYVIQTVAGGPAEKVGIYAGDRIRDCRRENEQHAYHENAAREKRHQGERSCETPRSVATHPVPNHSR